MELLDVPARCAGRGSSGRRRCRARRGRSTTGCRCAPEDQVAGLELADGDRRGLLVLRDRVVRQRLPAGLPRPHRQARAVPGARAGGAPAVGLADLGPGERDRGRGAARRGRGVGVGRRARGRVRVRRRASGRVSASGRVRASGSGSGSSEGAAAPRASCCAASWAASSAAASSAACCAAAAAAAAACCLEGLLALARQLDADVLQLRELADQPVPLGGVRRGLVLGGLGGGAGLVAGLPGLVLARPRRPRAPPRPGRRRPRRAWRPPGTRRSVPSIASSAFCSAEVLSSTSVTPSASTIAESAPRLGRELVRRDEGVRRTPRAGARRRLAPPRSAAGPHGRPWRPAGPRSARR